MNSCNACRFVYESALPVGRLVRDLADKAQVCTQRSWKRPYGVGLLVGGFDKTGAKLYYNCPSGNYYEYKANAVGARSQARVYSTLVLIISCLWVWCLTSACCFFVVVFDQLPPVAWWRTCPHICCPAIPHVSFIICRLQEPT